ncbi:unnamed protein product, partial [Closterium sp. Yama58-4]
HTRAHAGSPSHVCEVSSAPAQHTVQVAFLHSSGRDDGHDGIVSDCLRLLLPCPPPRTRLTCGEARVLREHGDGSGDVPVCCRGVNDPGEGLLGEERRVEEDQERVRAQGGSSACGAGEAGEWKVVKRWHVGSEEVGEQGHGEEGGMLMVAGHTAGSEGAVEAEGGVGAAEVGETVEVHARGRVAVHYGAQLRGFGRVLHALPPSLAHIPPHLVLPLQL